MNVLYVVHSFPPFHWRGTEVYAWELATAMAAHHSARVFHLVDDPPGDAPTLEDAEFRGLPVHRIRQRLTPTEPDKYFFNPDQEKLFADLLNYLRPDVVHFVYLAGGLSLNLPRLAREGGAKTIITVTDFAGICPRAQLTDRDGRPCAGPRGGLRCGWCLFGRTFIEGHSRVDRLLRERLPVALASLAPEPGTRLIRRRLAAVHDAFDHAALVAYPNQNCAALYRAAGFPAGRVMDYGIDLRPYAGHQKTPSPVPRIGFLGQLLPHKGLHVLTRALRGLQGDWRLVIYGNSDDPEAAKYLESADLDRDRAEFRGHFPFEKMNEVLSGIDVLVVPSMWMENCPLIVKYAAATRTWTLLSDQPGMIAARVSPALRFFPPGDADALRAALAVALGRVAAGERPAAGPTGVDDIAAQAEFFAGVYGGRA